MPQIVVRRGRKYVHIKLPSVDIVRTPNEIVVGRMGLIWFGFFKFGQNIVAEKDNTATLTHVNGGIVKIISLLYFICH